MEKITAIKLSKSEKDAQKELRRIVNTMVFTKFIKATCKIEDIVLVYLPYYIADFLVEIVEKKTKEKEAAYEHMYMSLDVGRQTRIKALTSIEELICSEIEIPEEMIAKCEIDEAACMEKLRSELVYRYIPRNTKNFNARQVELIKAMLVYRPQYLIKYKLFGRTRIYKVNGDFYNL